VIHTRCANHWSAEYDGRLRIYKIGAFPLSCYPRYFKRCNGNFAIGPEQKWSFTRDPYAVRASGRCSRKDERKAEKVGQFWRTPEIAWVPRYYARKFTPCVKGTCDLSGPRISHTIVFDSENALFRVYFAKFVRFAKALNIVTSHKNWFTKKIDNIL